jgi:hypothetical protein
MDKDMRLRAKAIRNLKEYEYEYDEDDILAEMDRLMEEEEEKEEYEKEKEEGKALLYYSKHWEEIYEKRREEARAKLLRLRALRKLKSRGVPYDDTDLELELDNQSRLCDKAEDNLDTSVYNEFWDEDAVRKEMERLDAEEEQRTSSATAESSKLRIQALRNLKALGDPFDEYDIEIEMATILESNASTPSKSANGKRK